MAPLLHCAALCCTRCKLAASTALPPLPCLWLQSMANSVLAPRRSRGRVVAWSRVASRARPLTRRKTVGIGKGTVLSGCAGYNVLVRVGFLSLILVRPLKKDEMGAASHTSKVETPRPNRRRPQPPCAMDGLTEESTTPPSVPMRRALNSVARYNERMNRARSFNNNPQKLPAQTSPAPRPNPGSARKERPARESHREKRKVEDGPSAPVPPPPSEAPTGIKNNPFLLADRKAAKPPKVPTAAPPKVPALEAVPTAGPAAEPRPIGSLSDAQRAVLQQKRMSLTSSADVEAARALLAPVRPAPVELPPDQMEMETETGVQVVPSPMSVTDEPVSAPEAAPATASPAAPTEPAKPISVAPPVITVGDLGFLQNGAPTELLAALRSMPEVLDGGLRDAKAIESTAEPLIDVLRRSQRGARPTKRSRR